MNIGAAGRCDLFQAIERLIAVLRPDLFLAENATCCIEFTRYTNWDLWEVSPSFEPLFEEDLKGELWRAV